MYQKLFVILMTALMLTACGGGALTDPYQSASGTSVYRVRWDGSGRGTLYDSNGNTHGHINDDDMRDWDGSDVNGYRLVNRSMYYNPNTNTLYLEDSAGGVGRAINTVATNPNDSNWSGLVSDGRKELIESVAKGINHKFSIPMERSRAIATALQTHHEAEVARGFSTEADVQKSFKTVFGVEYGDAKAAVAKFQTGDATDLRSLTDRSAAGLGISPAQAKYYMKEMYRKSLTQYGYDVDQLNW